MSLVSELGENYVREFFVGALFPKKNNLYTIRNCRENRLEVNRLDLDNAKSDWELVYLPIEELNTFSDIAWPKLGYRNSVGSDGNVVMYVTAQRSVLRGLRLDLLNWETIAVGQHLGVQLWNAPSRNRPNNQQYRELYRPTFIGYSQGMAKIHAGEWCSFAINEDVAIAVSCTDAAGYCDIFFRDKKVGSISESGDIYLSNKVIKRSMLQKLFTE